ncbi:hypothetical protein B4Q13_18835 [Lacticaseibacillus rhamnosus]
MARHESARCHSGTNDSVGDGARPRPKGAGVSRAQAKRPLERQRVFRPTVVARHALGAAVELPYAFLFSSAYLFLSAVGGHEIGVRLIAELATRLSA